MLRSSATAAYGSKNYPATYLGLWGVGLLCSLCFCVVTLGVHYRYGVRSPYMAGICTAAAVGSLYGFARMVRRFSKWSLQQPSEWLPLMPAARALVR
jgi:FtsH-binding integral membrane protein